MNFTPDQSDTSTSSQINPYAPTAEIDPSGVDIADGLVAEIPNRRVTGRTIFAVACSGASFGLLLGGTVMASGVFAMSGSSSTREMSSLMLGLGIYMVIGVFGGFMLAGLAAVLVTPTLMWLVGESEAFGGSGWDRRSVRLFGAVCGALCGWTTVVAISGFEPTGFILGLVPGAVGLIATPLFMRRLMKEADQNRKTY